MAGVVFAAAVVRRFPRSAVLAAVLAAGVLSGAAAAKRIEAAAAVAVVPGEVTIEAVVMTDPIPQDQGWRLLMRVRAVSGRGDIAAGSVVNAEHGEVLDVMGAVAGDIVVVAGALRDEPGRLRGEPHRAALRNARVVRRTPASDVWFAAGNAMRQLVLGRLAPHSHKPEGALLAGFLVGDTTRLPQDQLDDLRSSGLTHYVAVSGSNVALFLGAWWLVVGPIGLDPRWRAASGLVALIVFVVATRWEPSVVRAAAMAAVVLVGRTLSIPVDPWRALGVAVTVLLLVSGDLAADVGFQLSAFATAGVLIGMRVQPGRRPEWLWSIVTATIGAQLAVLPVLLLTFGTVPLLSPVANVVAAPLVGAATVMGGIGVMLGVDALTELGLLAGKGVLIVADHAAGWPQLGTLAAVATVVAGAGLRSPRWRMPSAAGLAGWLVVAALPVAPPHGAQLAFLSVGQGDAILIADGDRAVALVDGGRDPEVLEAALDRHGIRSIELVVVTHGDADHAAGLTGIVPAYGVAEVWYPAAQTPGPIVEDLLAEAAIAGAVTLAAATGIRRRVGTIDIQVLSPARRFAADNDGSIVLWVDAGGATALLTGDVEAVGQAELPDVRPDILHVPHHGSATTDLDWLASTVGSVAVISVGPNRFGHPSPAVLATLAHTNADVYVTQVDGDVVVPLDP